jgi:uncharacterized integral membrane protein
MRKIWGRFPAAMLTILFMVLIVVNADMVLAATNRLEPGAVLVKGLIMGCVGAVAFYFVQRSRNRKKNGGNSKEK